MRISREEILLNIIFFMVNFIEGALLIKFFRSKCRSKVTGNMAKILSTYLHHFMLPRHISENTNFTSKSSMSRLLKIGERATPFSIQISVYKNYFQIKNMNVPYSVLQAFSYFQKR